MTTNPYAPPKALVADTVEGDAAPALWNPNAAACWSLLFSPAFGAFLHMKNWQVLGESEKAVAAKTWVVVTLVSVIGLGLVSAVMPHNGALNGISRIFGLVLLVSWYSRSGKPQVAFVTSRYGKQYPKRGWAKPLLCAIAAFVGFLVVVAAAAAAAQMFRRVV